jgi:hypothetical protein
VTQDSDEKDRVVELNAATHIEGVTAPASGAISELPKRSGSIQVTPCKDFKQT